MKSFVMGLDVGTGSAKCVAASTDGLHLWTAESSYRYESPHPGWAEQDPSTWWNASILAIRRLLAEHPDIREGLAGIAVCGQGAAAVLLDEKYQPTRPAILWLDSRSAPQARHLMERHGEEIARCSGKPPAAYNVEPKLLWVAEHEPEVWKRTASFMTATAYLTYRLSGRAVINRSDAGILLSYDLREKGWSPDLARQMGIPGHFYCPLADCHEIIGGLTPAAASESGLLAGTPVLAGGEDTSAAALAAGAVSPECAILSLGTAGTLYCPCPQVLTHPRLLSFPHVLSSLTLIGGSTVCGGSGLEWITKLLRGNRTSADIQALCSEASLIPLDSSRLVFLPYLSGELQPVNDGFARGVFFGADFSTSAPELVAAVMQGTAFAIAHNLEIVRQVFAGPLTLIAAGTPSRNRALIQTISDATNLPIHVIEEHGGAALGAAILAAQSIEKAAAGYLLEVHRKILYRTMPRQERQTKLAQLFAIYKELYCRLKDLFPRLQVFAGDCGCSEGI